MRIDSDKKLIESIKGKFSKSTVIDLSDFLKMPSSSISIVERGVRPFNWYSRVKILSSLEYDLAKKAVSTMDTGKLVERVKLVTKQSKLSNESEESKSLLEIASQGSNVCSVKALNSFKGYIENKYGDCGHSTLDQDDRIKLIEVLYRDNPSKWGALAKMLSRCASANDVLAEEIESVLERNNLGNMVLRFLAEHKGCESDKELAKELKLTPSQLSRMRNGKTGVSERVVIEASFLARSKLNDGIKASDFFELDSLANDSELILKKMF